MNDDSLIRFTADLIPDRGDGYAPWDLGMAWWRVPSDEPCQVVDYECDVLKGGGWKTVGLILDTTSEGPVNHVSGEVDMEWHMAGERHPRACREFRSLTARPGSAIVLLFRRDASGEERLPFRARLILRRRRKPEDPIPASNSKE
jgi:hypothetical protein